MRKFSCTWFSLVVMSLVTSLILGGCGGSSSSGTSGNSTTVKKAVSGTVSFPALSSLVAKQVAAAPGTVIPPVLTITDLSGAIIATPTLTVDPSDPKKFTYTANLDASKNYVFKASWGGQVLRSLADQSTLSSLATVIDVTPVSTAAVLVAEKNLNLTSGQLGTTAASAITAEQVNTLNSADLLAAVGTPTYATLVTAVTTALTGLKDPAGVAAVTTAVSTAPAFVLTSLAVTPATQSIVVGATQQFTATGTYSDASTKDLTGAVVWSSSSISVATIATSGVATAVAAGTATITATSGAIKGTAVLTATTPITTPASGSVQAILQSGMYGTDIGSYKSGTATVTGYASVLMGLNGTVVTQTTTYYDPTSKTWTTTLPAGIPATGVFWSTDTSYVLSTSGWVSESNGLKGGNLTFNSDGSAIITDSASGANFKLEITATDIAGQTITQAAVPNLDSTWPTNPSAGNFPAGSLLYHLVVTTLTGAYKIENNSGDFSSSWGTLNGLIADTGWGHSIDSNDNSNWYFANFVSGGSTVDIYQQPVTNDTPTGARVKIGSGTYTKSILYGQEIVEINVPTGLRTQYKLGSNPIFAIIFGTISRGGHDVPGVDYSGGGYALNSIAMQFLQSQKVAAKTSGAVSAQW